MAEPTFNWIAPSFVVPDVRRTAEWYRDNLGFEINGYFFEEPPVYAIVSRGDVYIHFGRSDSGDVHIARSIRKMGIEAWVRVTGIQELYDELIGRGVDVPYPPTRRIYDRTEIEVTDCDGHKLVFGE